MTYPTEGDERPLLEGWLDFHRATLVRKCDGLTPEQMRTRSVPPSTLTLLGLLRHLTDVERYWLGRVLLDERVPMYSTRDDPDADFDGLDQDPAEALVEFATACGESRRIVAAFDDLDVTAKRQRHGSDVSLRWILIHLIEEYARHNGHADLLREAIDGQTGL